MPRLVSDLPNGFGSVYQKNFANIVSGTKTTFSRHTSHMAISAGLKLLIGNLGQSPLIERIGEGAAGVANILARVLSTRPDSRDTSFLEQSYPGYIAVYSDTKLDKIIPLQFEARVTSDSRSAAFESLPYGLSETSTYKSTSLRRISLTTYYATTDPFYYSSNFVEQRVREMQSLVYADQGQSTRERGARALIAPPIIGLFIGEKFMRRRLPRLVLDNFEEEGAFLEVKEVLNGVTTKKIPFLKNIAEPLIDLIKYFVSREPIYWKVNEVSAEWDEFPTNINFDEGNGNFAVGQGEQKLPMAQRIILSLTEHRAPNAYERRNDVDSFVTWNNIAGRIAL